MIEAVRQVGGVASQYVTGLMNNFAKYDVDGDGTIDRLEFEVLWEHLSSRGRSPRRTRSTGGAASPGRASSPGRPSTGARPTTPTGGRSGRSKMPIVASITTSNAAAAASSNKTSSTGSRSAPKETDGKRSRATPRATTPPRGAQPSRPQTPIQAKREALALQEQRLATATKQVARPSPPSRGGGASTASNASSRRNRMRTSELE